MPKGIHSSIRVALAVAPKIHEQLKAWADYEGRPVASLCMYLIEHSLRQAQKDGIAPSFANEEVDRIDKVEPRFLGHRYETTAKEPVDKEKRFTQMYEDKLAERSLGRNEAKLEEERKKEKLFQLLQELTKD